MAAGETAPNTLAVERTNHESEIEIKFKIEDFMTEESNRFPSGREQLFQANFSQ